MTIIVSIDNYQQLINIKLGNKNKKNSKIKVNNQSLLLEIRPNDKILRHGFFCFEIKDSLINKYSFSVLLSSNNNFNKNDLTNLINSLNQIYKSVKNQLSSDYELVHPIYIPKNESKPMCFNILIKKWSVFKDINDIISDLFIKLKYSFKAILFVKFDSVSFLEKTQKWYINYYLHTAITTEIEKLNLRLNYK